MNYVVAVIHRVDDLQETQAFLSRVLDFKRHDQGEDWLVMENGAQSIRLTNNAEISASTLHLDVSSNDLEASTRYFTQCGFSQNGELRWANKYRQEMLFTGPHDLALTVFHELNEDDLDIYPDLPTTLNWQEDALELTKRLLRAVPVSFRERARLKVTEAAEADAIVDGQIEVNLTVAIQALIKVTPDFQHQSLKEEMQHNGLNPGDYFANG